MNSLIIIGWAPSKIEVPISGKKSSIPRTSYSFNNLNKIAKHVRD